MGQKNDTTKHVRKPNGDLMFLKSGTPSVMTVTAGAVDMNKEKAPVKQTTKKPDQYSGADKWFPWGDDDNYPAKLLKYLSKIGVAETAIDHNADLHFGAGIEWFKKVYDGGTITYVPQGIPQWDGFVSRTNFLVNHAEMLQYLETYYLAFVEVVMTKNMKDVFSVRPLDSFFCRFKKSDSGKLTHIYFVHNIDSSRNEHDEIPLFDATKIGQQAKFVIPVKYACPGMPYYSKPNFNSLIENGWADIIVDVPKYIKSVYKNQTTLKYHIKIPYSYFRLKYKDWDSKDEKEQLQLQEEYKAHIDEAITGAERAGVSVMSIYDDEALKEPVQIEPIKNLIDSSQELPNAFAGNAEVLFAYSIDPTLLGVIPGGKGNLAGSGSDKRESRANRQKNLKRERQVSLQVLRVLQMILPKFPQDVIPMYVDADNSQTLDKNPTGSQNTVV